jgi:hypothetical protein
MELKASTAVAVQLNLLIHVDPEAGDPVGVGRMRAVSEVDPVGRSLARIHHREDGATLGRRHWARRGIKSGRNEQTSQTNH